VRTIGRAKAIVRDGYPDWLLLRRGDTFTSGFGSWERSGRSASEPCVIWSYGTGARPVVAPSSGSAWSIVNDARHHIYVMGIDFVGNRDGSTGLWVAAADGTSDLLFEDLRIRGWSMGMAPQGVNDLRIRRCSLYENGNPNGHGQGIFVNLCDGVLVEECVFDMNGWVQGSFAATIFDHNLYFSDENENCVLRGNIIARASSHGAHFRSGGTVEGNLFLHNPINLQFGYAQGSTNGKPNGVTGEVRGNVTLGGGDIDGQERGASLILQNVASATVEDNVFAHGTGGFPTTLSVNAEFGIGVHDVTLDGNVWYRWGGATNLNGTNVTGMTIQNNDFQEPSGGELWYHSSSGLSGSAIASSGNRFYSTTTNPYRIPSRTTFSGWQSWIGDSTSTQTLVDYPDPDLTIADYDASIGGTGSLASFLAEARKQCRDDWRTDYTAAAAVEYFRTAFGR
jgi:hypothetical protein